MPLQNPFCPSKPAFWIRYRLHSLSTGAPLEVREPPWRSCLPLTKILCARLLLGRHFSYSSYFLVFQQCDILIFGTFIWDIRWRHDYYGLLWRHYNLGHPVSHVVIFSYSSMNIPYSYFRSEYGICFHVPFDTLGSFVARRFLLLLPAPFRVKCIVRRGFYSFSLYLVFNISYRYPGFYHY